MDPEFMYRWRKMTGTERAETMRDRKANLAPWHSPPHRESLDGRYLITTACYEHLPIIGASFARLAAFESELIENCRIYTSAIWAWTVLPNHYHILVESQSVLELLKVLGQLHGRTSHGWNGEDGSRGRKVWHGAVETAMKSEGHFSATVNYVHNNSVKHGYVSRWQDWPFSNAREYLEKVGRDEAERVWKEYPIGSYGMGWDD